MSFRLNGIKKCLSKIKNKKKSHATFESMLQIIASILTVLGISVASISGALINYMPCVQRNKAEKAAEKIRVTESQEYIESVLGTPQQTLEIEYKDTVGNTLVGKKSVFVADFYIFVTYYDEFDTCIGYFLIKNDKKFSPELYYEERAFDLSVPESEIDNLGYLSAVGHFTNSRADCSSFHIQYYSHHLALNGCYVGLGFTNLGEIDNDIMQNVYEYSHNWNGGYLAVTNENRNEIELLEKRFANMEPNVFSVFLANDTYDVDELLSRELKMCLSLNHIDLRILK